jgi:hypothetical protein
MVMMKNRIPLQAFSIVIADRQHAVPPTLPLAQRKIIQMIKKAICSILLMGLCFTASRVSADDAALIDALVRKGILNQKEADSIEKEVNDEAAQASQQNANPLNSVLKIGSWIKELDLYGDLRLRNYYQNNQSQLPASNSARFDNQVQRDRWRFRLRLNADFKLDGNFFGGVQLSTSDNRDAVTGNATFTGGYDNYNIYISRAFMGWAPVDGLTFVAGRQENPFFATEMFWGPDEAPNGLVERVDFHKLFNWGSSETTSTASATPGYSKDGKTASPSPGPAAPSPGSPFELSLIAGQFIFFNNNADSGNTELKWDAYQFETQLQGKLHLFQDRVSVTWAPGIFAANNAALGPTGFLPNGQPNPATAPAAGTGVLGSLNNANPFPVTQRDELFLLAPGEISFKLGKIPVSVYWDLSYNLLGDDRFNDVYGPLFGSVTYTKTNTPVFSNRLRPSFSDNFAWLVGVRAGQNKKAGDLGGLVDFRQIGIDAVDPNINSDDFGNSFLNMQGVRVNLAYNLTDFAVISFTGWFSWNLTGSLYGGFATTPSSFPLANVNAAQTFAVDLLLKF